MRARPWLLLAPLGISGCNIAASLGGIPRDCEERQVWYPDADGDGLGEPNSMYVGCDAPEGWVTQLGLPDTGATTTDTGTPPEDTDTEPSTTDTDSDTQTGSETDSDTDSARDSHDDTFPPDTEGR